MSRPTVLLVSHYYEPHVGGIEAVVRAEAHALVERGFRVDVLTSACGGRPGRSRSGEVSVRRVRAWNGFEGRLGVPFPVFSPTLLWHALRLVRRADVVHVHEHLYLTSWVVALVCRILGRPYVVTQHVGPVDHPSPVVRAIQAAVHRTAGRFVMRGASAVLPINAFIEESVRTAVAPGSRVEVVGNGVDPTRYHPPGRGEKVALRERLGLPLDQPVVLFVGRFVPKKGFPTVARAGSPAYTLVFVGGDRPEIAPADHVFLGSRTPDEVAEIYRAADLYVGASVGECPLSVLEAMSSGLPAVLREDPGYRALGVDGPGVTWVEGDGWRPALEAIVADRAGLARRAEAARRTAVEAYSWDAHAEALERIYAEAAA